MTGYGRGEAAGARLALHVECKSVNHRHHDVALKLPRGIASLEPDVRRLIQGKVGRGRIEVSVTIQPVEGGALTPLGVDLAQARQYALIVRQLAEETNLAIGATATWLCEQPGVVTREAEPTLTSDDAWPLLEQALTQALGELVARRSAEGLALRHDLEGLSAILRGQVDSIAERAPAAVARRTARLRERIQSLLGDTAFDESRIAVEVAVWADKTDISEELTRLRAHLDQLAALLAEGGAVGRTLDFLIQEMNREVNTVGSKSDDLEISQTVIAAKSTLEKLREQAQNIE